MFLKHDSRWKQQRNISEVPTGIETKKIQLLTFFAKATKKNATNQILRIKKIVMFHRFLQKTLKKSKYKKAVKTRLTETWISKLQVFF